MTVKNVLVKPKLKNLTTKSLMISSEGTDGLVFYILHGGM